MKKLFLISALMFIGIANAATLVTVLGTPTYKNTNDVNGDAVAVTYTIPIQVTSSGGDLYLGQTAQLASTATGTNAFAFVFRISSDPNVNNVVLPATVSLTSTDAVMEKNAYRIEDGATKNFILTVVLSSVKLNASYRVCLRQIRFFTEADLTNGTNLTLVPDGDFCTDYRLINHSLKIDNIHQKNEIEVSVCPSGIRIYSEKDAVVEVYSITGAKLFSGNCDTKEAQIFSLHTPGMYIVLLSVEGKKITKKVWIN